MQFFFAYDNFSNFKNSLCIMSVKVTKREDTPENKWKNWNWRSTGDLMLNGAFFTPSGAGASSSYAKASSLGARPSSLVGTLTYYAGALTCKQNSKC
jgi:pectate lyase